MFIWHCVTYMLHITHSVLLKRLSFGSGNNSNRLMWKTTLCLWYHFRSREKAKYEIWKCKMGACPHFSFDLLLRLLPRGRIVCGWLLKRWWNITERYSKLSRSNSIWENPRCHFVKAAVTSEDTRLHNTSRSSEFTRGIQMWWFQTRARAWNPKTLSSSGGAEV